MGVGRGAIGVAVLCAIVLTGCTSTSHSADPLPVAPATQSAAVSPTPSATVATSPRPTATRVPIDQIPPGNPVSWVPAGVATTAKYREPGDVVPMFNQAMFHKTPDGALAMARYYIEARNWASAINDYKPVMLTCDAAHCRAIAPYYAQLRAKNQHLALSRVTTGPPTVFAVPKSNGTQFVVRLKVYLAAQKVIDNDGLVVLTNPGLIVLTDLHMKWTGSLWRVDEDLVAK